MHRSRLHISAIAALGLLFATPAPAEASTTRFRNCLDGAYAGRIPVARREPMRFCMATMTRLHAIGWIDAAAPGRFTAFLNEMLSIGWTPKSVTFDSPGGDMDAAIRLGVLIRRHGLDTHVAWDAICGSGCFLAFLGGNNREAAPGGALGNHRFSTPGNLERETEFFRRVEYQLGRYHEAMGIDVKAIARAHRAAHDRMHWFSCLELLQWRIVTEPCAD